MSWDELRVDDYGQIGKLTCVDEDGAAVDISSYTTLQIILTNPSGTAAVKTAAFDSDGTDGIVKYTLQNGDIAVSGNWRAQARVSKTGAEITSDHLDFYVTDRLD